MHLSDVCFNIFLFFSLVNAFPQTNFHLTNINDREFAHDCLRFSILPTSKKDTQEIVSFCLTNSTLNWSIQVNPLDQNYTFANLRQQNVTTEQLYQWSASIDLIEQYQFYLMYNESSMSTAIFYNCSKPRFGSYCQYEFLYLPSDNFTLRDTILYLYQIDYEPTSLTCYVHLKCNRGSKSICLDWTEICDQYVHCVDDQADEKLCGQLLINECHENEYRCRNGQCISKEFVFDEPNVYECFDRSDHFATDQLKLGHEKTYFEPRINYEDQACIKIDPNIKFTLQVTISSSCDPSRYNLLKIAMYNDVPTTISHICYISFYCMFYREASRHFLCLDICENDQCILQISETCPDLIVIVPAPLAFGHVSFGYFKQTDRYSVLRVPDFICYDVELCRNFQSNNNVTVFQYNNQTCRLTQDILPSFFISGRFVSTLGEHINALQKGLQRCNTISFENTNICTNRFMYRCKNSTECISIHRLCNQIYDCDYGDDEDCQLVDGVCSPIDSDLLFKCPLNNICISPSRFGNNMCDCEYVRGDEKQLCEDEPASTCQTDTIHECNGFAQEDIIQKTISFSTICDGHQELTSIPIDGMNHTDESECQFWPCNNSYTHCDGYWNCWNGIDEINCDEKPVINCSVHHHICIEPGTFKLICLPLEKANDGHIDCVGAMDEPTICQYEDYNGKDLFYCDGINECTSTSRVCVYVYPCLQENQDIFCAIINNVTYRNDSSLYRYFHSIPDRHSKVRFKYFALEQSFTNEQLSPEPAPELVQKTLKYDFECHRGYPLRLHSDHNQIICLCPPNYYGPYCQYQNQRVTLTLQFQTYSDSRQTLFTLVIQLIDNATERIIHSSKQITFIYIKHCQTKFNFYLIYATRPKQPDRIYSIHIDIYEKENLAYQESLLIPLEFSFLPVHRISYFLTIPRHQQSTYITCSCINGQCLKYAENTNALPFCKCHAGWTGKNCSIRYNCTCASSLSCVGIEANGRSICICPLDRWGPRCLLLNTICQSNTTCLNNGQCILTDDEMISEKKFFCICPKGFTGDRCEFEDAKLVITFDRKNVFADSILIHFIEIQTNGPVQNGSTFQWLPIYQNEVTIRWPHPFHIVFIELSNKIYYLISVEKHYNRSKIIQKSLSSSDRCGHMNEYVNSTIANFVLIRRIKYYHLPCQQSISCFYDQDHFCLCSQQLANCFRFNPYLVHNCFKLSTCQNDGQCVQDHVACPQISRCNCRECTYGSLCQFKSSLFDISLDSIIGYHIQPNIRLSNQILIVKIALSLIVIIVSIGIINGLLCFLTFQRRETRQVGCGYYLYGSAVITLLTSILLILKFFLLLYAQMSVITNRLFLNIQCYSIDYLLDVCLNMSRWLNGCIALERAYSAYKGVNFNKNKSIQIAKYTLVILSLFVIVSVIYDPIHRQLVDDDSNDQYKRIWCIVSYPSRLLVFNRYMHMFHFFVPFALNIISSLIIITLATKRRQNFQTDLLFHQVLVEQIQQNRHLLISPAILILLSLPRIIISFLAGCMQSNSSPWIHLIGYLVSYLPSMLIFVIFVLPSKLYIDEFRKSIKKYPRIFQMLFSCLLQSSDDKH